MIKTINHKTYLNRNNQMDSKFIINEIEKIEGLDNLNQLESDNIRLFQVNQENLIDIIKILHNFRYNLESIFASDGKEFFELNYLFHQRPYKKNSLIIFQTQIKKGLQVKSIINFYKNALYFEKNIKNRLGLEFILISDNQKEEILEYCAPYIFPNPIPSHHQERIGVFDPIHEKNSYIDINTKDNVINTVKIRDGWMYNKTQPRLEACDQLNDYKKIFRRFSQNNKISINLLHNQILELATEKKVPLKAKFIRTLLAELERIYSHLLWFTNLANLLHKYFTGKKINKINNSIDKITKKFLKVNNLDEMLYYGSSQDIIPKISRELYHYFRDNEIKIFDTVYNFVYNSNTENRLSGIGIIPQKDAFNLGLKGPSLRGSGIPDDIRLKDPYLTYCIGDLSQIWNVIAFKKGDVYARTQVRLWEIKESLAICKHILHGLSSYEKFLENPVMPKQITLTPNHHYIKTIEAPQGAFSMYYRTDFHKSRNNFHTIRLITPDAANYAAIDYGILLKENIKDVPIIIHSLDLNFPLIDL